MNRPQRRGSGLLAIDRAPSGELWAVGWQEQRAGQPRPYIATLRKGRWRSVTSPALPDGTAVLTDVEMHDAREGWAVGYLVAQAGRSPHRLPAALGRPALDPAALPWADEVAAVPRSVLGRRRRPRLDRRHPDRQRAARGARLRGQRGRRELVGRCPRCARRCAVGGHGRGRDLAGGRRRRECGRIAARPPFLPDPATPAAKAKGKAKANAKGTRIKVSHMKARRRARDVEDVTALIEGESAEVAPLTIAAKGKPTRLRAPVPPTGFRCRTSPRRRASPSGP